MSPERIIKFPDLGRKGGRKPDQNIEAPLAKVYHLDNWRLGDTDKVAEDLISILSVLMQPPPVLESWQAEGNLWIHDRLMAGKTRRWSSLYDRDEPGVVLQHPMAPEAEWNVAERLLEAGSSLAKFITSQAAKRSENMSDEDIIGIPKRGSEEYSPSPSAA